MNRIIIQVDSQRRIVVYPEGGLQLEAKMNGSWFIDNTEVSDSVIEGHLQSALAILSRAADKMPVY